MLYAQVSRRKHEHAKGRNKRYKQIQVKLKMKNKISEMKIYRIKRRLDTAKY